LQTLEKAFLESAGQTEISTDPKRLEEDNLSYDEEVVRVSFPKTVETFVCQEFLTR